MNEYRKIQADRRRREKQHGEDWRLAGLPPHDPSTDYDGPRPDALDKNEAIHAEEITEDFNEDTTIATRPRKPHERRGGKKPQPGGNGIDKTTARAPLAHPDGSGRGPDRNAVRV